MQPTASARAKTAPENEAMKNFDASIAARIDHTLLKPEATAGDIRRICEEALEYTFASVCVNPYWVPLVASALKNSAVKVCTVVGFPLGASATAIKAAETRQALQDGAHEIDMVLNVGELRDGNLAAVSADIVAVVEISHAANAIVKVILETALLNDSQKIAACEVAKEAGADFVKTSTGFASSGATEHDIALMRKAVGPNLGVKASGGIRTLEDLNKMIAAGASRVGASASVKIMEATVA